MAKILQFELKSGTPLHTARSITFTPSGIGIPASPIMNKSLCPSDAMHLISSAFRIPLFFIVHHLIQSQTQPVHFSPESTVLPLFWLLQLQMPLMLPP